MAQIGNGRSLPIDDPNVAGGLVLTLDRAARRPFDYSGSSGRVLLAPDSNLAVCSITTPVTTYESVIEVGYPLIQEALDLFGARHAYWHLTPEGWARNCAWWHGARGVVLRWTDFVTLSPRFEANFVITRADGTVERSEDTPLPPWREALRYLRWSQTTDDLYDAYRNAYLALESLLSSVRPKKAGEREKDWTLAALNDLELRGIVISQFIAGASTSSAAQSFYDEQYVAHRCAQDHAKLTAPRYLPATLADRATVSDALINLTRFVVETIRTVDGSGPGLGGATTSGMKMIADTSKSMELHVTEDSSPAHEEDVSVSPQGLPTTTLVTSYCGQVDQIGYEYGWIGEVEHVNMSSPLVNRAAGTVSGDGGTIAVFAADVPSLDTTGASVLEVAVSFLFGVSGGLKRHFAR